MKTCTGRERMSSGEYTIKGILEAMSIHFIREMRFADCKDSNTLPFDFYLPQHTAVIEYDGLQHFEAVEYFGGQETFEYTQRHDQIKNAYCAANNIRLLRIKYTDFEKVEDLIREFIQSC
jgi:very-short-patch-repair endonuclease